MYGVFDDSHQPSTSQAVMGADFAWAVASDLLPILPISIYIEDVQWALNPRDTYLRLVDWLSNIG
jgi:hypothetical protein